MDNLDKLLLAGVGIAICKYALTDSLPAVIGLGLILAAACLRGHFTRSQSKTPDLEILGQNLEELKSRVSKLSLAVGFEKRG